MRILSASMIFAACLAAAPSLAAERSSGGSEAGFKAARNMFGQPDLGGYWSNSTITPAVRPPIYGDRLNHTDEEVRRLEQAIAAEVEDGNQSTDPNAPAPKQGGEIKEGTRPEFVAAGGAVGFYDRGWLDPGSTVMRVAGQARTSLLTTPNGQVPPRRPGAAAPATANAGRSFDNPEGRGLGERCIISFGRNGGPPMFANGFYNNNYQIVQGPDHVAIEVEMVHDVRMIRLNSRHRTDGVRPWFGDSIGWYDGDTLVVETTNIPQAQAYFGSWEKLKVTERFTRVGQQSLHYAFTIEDPDAWEASWGGEYEFHPLEGRIMEYACHEGNYALEGILAGARAEEAAEAGPAAGR